MKLATVIAAMCIATPSNAGRGLENSAARKAIVEEIVGIASNYRIIPVLRTPVLHSNDTSTARHHGNALDKAIYEAISAREDIVNEFLQLMYDPQHNIDVLIDELYEVLANVASAYVSRQPSTRYSKFSWMWGGNKNEEVGKLNDHERKLILWHVFKATMYFRAKLRAREGDSSDLAEAYEMLMKTVSNKQQKDEDWHKVSNMVAFYREFPELSYRLNQSEIKSARQSISTQGSSALTAIDELQLELWKSVNDTKPQLQSEVAFLDLYKETELIRRINNYYSFKGTSDEFFIFQGDPADYLITFEMSRLKSSPLLNALFKMGKPNAKSTPDEGWGVTWEQLHEPRTLSAAVGELLTALHWHWHDLAAALYPQDTQAAIRFITTYPVIDAEEVEQALQAYRAKQHDAKITAPIDAFIAELPRLTAKNTLVNEAIAVQQRGQLTEEDTVHVGLKRTSPRAILTNAINTELLDGGRWHYLNLEHIKNHHEWYVPTFAVIASLREIGLTETQLQEQIFTAGFPKLLRGDSIDMQDLIAIRQLLQTEKIHELLVGQEYDPEVRQALMKKVMFLPLALQLETLLQKLSGNTSTDGALLKTVQELTQDKMLEPLITTMLALHKPSATHSSKKRSKRRKRSSNPLRNIRLTLNKVSREMSTARDHYFVASNREQPANAGTTQKNETQQQLASIKAAKEKEFRNYVQNAQRLQARIVAQHAAKIGRGGLPHNTPIWLRLQAMLSYTQISAEELIKRAAMKAIDVTHFEAMIAPEGGVNPTAAELDKIKTALVQHTLNREKRHEISVSKRADVVENIDTEIDKIKALIK